MSQKIKYMENIALKQVYSGGITIQVPEIWNVETEEIDEIDGQKSYSIGISATGHDVRSMDISFGPLPDGSLHMCRRLRYTHQIHLAAVRN